MSRKHLECVAGIQARLSSSRLPGKVLADLGGRPLIQRVYERTRAARLVDEVVVLTSSDPSDDPLVERLEELAIPYRRGPLDDVLARYVELIDELEPRFVVRVTGDCPFVEPEFIDLQLGALRAFDADFVELGGNERGALDGTLGGQAALSRRTLRYAQASSDPRDREHAGSFFLATHRASFKVVPIDAEQIFRRPGLRLAVDEPVDLAFARAVWSAVDTEKDGLFLLEDAIAWIDAHPEVRALNRGVQESADNRALRRLMRERTPQGSPEDVA